MEVAEWLRALGLEQYETAFRENGVRAEVLCHLTAEDLKELGVTAVGHRRELLIAIAKLNEQLDTDTVSSVVEAAIAASNLTHWASVNTGVVHPCLSSEETRSSADSPSTELRTDPGRTSKRSSYRLRRSFGVALSTAFARFF